MDSKNVRKLTSRSRRASSARRRIRHIDEGLDEVERAAIGAADDRQVGVDEDRGAGLREAALLEPDRVLAVDERLLGADARSAVVGVRQLEGGPSDELLGRMAQQAPQGAVDPKESAVERDQRLGDGAVLEAHSKALVRLELQLLGGDVAHRRHDAGLPVDFDGVGGGVAPQLAALFVFDACSKASHAPLGVELVEEPLPIRGIGPEAQVVGELPDGLLPRVAGELLEAAADLEEAPRGDLGDEDSVAAVQ